MVQGCVMHGVVDSLVIGFMALAELQIKVLASNVVNIGYKTVTQTTYESISLELKKCINHHQAIIRIVKEIQRIFEIAFFVQCSSFASIVCTVTLVLSTVRYSIDIWEAFSIKKSKHIYSIPDQTIHYAIFHTYYIFAGHIYTTTSLLLSRT